LCLEPCTLLNVFIQKIFLSEGLLLALIGGGTGMLLALITAWLQINFHLIPLQGGSFLIDYFPVKHIRCKNRN
jgi:lipoprotein-releasing system permease protein